MDKKFYINRRDKLTELIDDNSLVLLFAGRPKCKSSDTDFPFAPERNFYYMTGVDDEGCVLIISKTGGKGEIRLFVQRPDEYRIRYFGPMKDAAEYLSITGIDDVYYTDEFDRELGRLLRDCGNVYLSLNRRVMDRIPGEAELLAQDLHLMYPHLEVKNIYPHIFNMRVIKDEQERELISRAIDITSSGIESMLRALRPGVGENELQAHFEFALRTLRSGGNAFNPIIASGPNSLALHYEKNCRTIGPDELVLLDLGAEYGYYGADISRTFPSSGKFTDKQCYYYEAVLEAQQEAIAIMRPGVEMRKTREIANKVLAPYLKRDRMITSDDEVARYLNHGICHCIGLDVHEGDSMIMEEGMVLTCEPGIYMHEYGFGIRIEDDIHITGSGHKLMSHKIIKEPDAIEEFMKNVRP